MFKNPRGFLELEIFRPYPELVHGFSTRDLGDVSLDQSIFLKKLNVTNSEVVKMNQIHGNGVREVGKVDNGKMIPQTDGLFTNEKGVYLRASGADCLPLLFYNPETKNAAVVHVGWKGTLTNILEKTLLLFKNNSSDLEDILVGFGPGIGVCCYDVDKERADKFKEKFGEEVVLEKEGKNYLDLFKANYFNLLKLGILKENVQASVFCTVDHSNLVYSSRADGGLKGKFAAIIGVRDNK